MSLRSLQKEQPAILCARYTEEEEETRKISDEGCISVCVRVVKRQSEGKRWRAEGGKSFFSCTFAVKFQ